MDALRIIFDIHHTYVHGHRVLLWMYRNDMKGKKIVEFFQNESKEQDGRSRLDAVHFALKKIFGDVQGKMTVLDLR